jgi:putative Mg2+ transporter-C (MgtC) family protein
MAALLSWQYEVDLPRIIDHMLRIGAAVGTAGVIGLERELHGRAAGFRTHVLVALGAAVVMIGAADLYLLLPDPSQVAVSGRLDPGRVVQGIITGIGFLGAGVIVKGDDNKVRGLTTAASLWMVAGLGLLCGAGQIVLAALGAAIAWVTLVLFRYVERILPSDVYETVIFRTSRMDDGYTNARKVVEAAGAKVQGFRLSRHNDDGELRVEMVLVWRKRQRDRGEVIVNELSKLPGTLRVQWSVGQE